MEAKTRTTTRTTTLVSLVTIAVAAAAAAGLIIFKTYQPDSNTTGYTTQTNLNHSTPRNINTSTTTNQNVATTHANTTSSPTDTSSAAVTDSVEPKAIQNAVSVVTLDSVSDTNPDAITSYSGTITTADTISTGAKIRLLFVTNDLGTTDYYLGGAVFTASGIDGKSSVVSNTNGDSIFQIELKTDLAAGTYSFDFDAVENASTEGDYALLSTSVGGSTGEYAISNAITLVSNPCVYVTITDLTDVTADAFGTNIAVDRGTVESVVSYQVRSALSSSDITTATPVDFNTDTEYIISNLAENSDYTVLVEALDVNSCVAANATVTATTEDTIAETNYSEPTLESGSLKKRSVQIRWTSDAFVSSYRLQLWRGSHKLKTFKNITTNKKRLTKKYLKSGKKYKVRVRTVYVTAEKTKWSDYLTFTTKD